MGAPVRHGARHRRAARDRVVGRDPGVGRGAGQPPDPQRDRRRGGAGRTRRAPAQPRALGPAVHDRARRRRRPVRRLARRPRLRVAEGGDGGGLRTRAHDRGPRRLDPALQRVRRDLPGRRDHAPGRGGARSASSTRPTRASTRPRSSTSRSPRRCSCSATRRRRDEHRGLHHAGLRAADGARGRAGGRRRPDRRADHAGPGPRLLHGVHADGDHRAADDAGRPGGPPAGDDPADPRAPRRRGGDGHLRRRARGLDRRGRPVRGGGAAARTRRPLRDLGLGVGDAPARPPGGAAGHGLCLDDRGAADAARDQGRGRDRTARRRGRRRGRLARGDRQGAVRRTDRERGRRRPRRAAAQARPLAGRLHGRRIGAQRRQPPS